MKMMKLRPLHGVSHLSTLATHLTVAGIIIIIIIIIITILINCLFIANNKYRIQIQVYLAIDYLEFYILVSRPVKVFPKLKL